jgi:hypothetical protein
MVYHESAQHPVPQNARAQATWVAHNPVRLSQAKWHPVGQAPPPAANAQSALVGPRPLNHVAIYKKYKAKGGKWWAGHMEYKNFYQANLTRVNTNTTYKEYDVDEYTGAGRGAERIILGADGSAYYTSNHYVDLTRFTP